MKKIKRMIAALVSTVIMAVLPSGVQSDAATKTRTYRKYNFSTGQVTNYSLTQTDQTPTFTTSDSQIRAEQPGSTIYKTGNSGVVRLEENGSGIGTGFIVGDHTIACAAHSVFHSNGATQAEQFPSSVTIYFYDDDGMPTNVSTQAAEVHVPMNYINLTNYDYDFALLTVSMDMSSYTHYNLGFAVDINSTDFQDIDLFASGAFYDGLDTAKGHILSSFPATTYRIYHSASTHSGASGGPLYVVEKCTKGSQVYYSYTALGIHDGGTENYRNVAHRFTTNDMQFYRSNSYISY